MSQLSERAKLSAPVCITWQITGKCNLRCIHCLAGNQGSRAGEMDLRQMKAFVNDLAGMRVFYINIGGGEPLLHPYFFDLADYASKKGVYVQFSTNGTLITGGLAEQIVKLGLRVQVSLDGWEPAVNDLIRGDRSFDQALAAVRTLHQKNAAVSVNCVVTNLVVDHLESMYRLVTSLGARLRLSRLRPSGRAGKSWAKLALTREQHFALYRWLLAHPDVTTGDSFFFLSSLGQPLPGLSYCGAGRLTCAVDPEGFVYPCAFAMVPSLAAGNVNLRPFSQIWHDAGSFAAIQQAPPPLCRDCGSFRGCRGGCRGAAFSFYADWHKPDPECLRGEEHASSLQQTFV